MRARIIGSLAAIVALALGASAAYADQSLTPGFVDDVMSDGGPPAFVADLKTDGGPPAWVETGSPAGSETDEDTSDEDSDEDTSDQDGSEDALLPDEANVPEWVADVKTDGGPPAWVDTVKTDGGPAEWVSTQRSTSANPRGH